MYYLILPNPTGSMIQVVFENVSRSVFGIVQAFDVQLPDEYYLFSVSSAYHMSREEILSEIDQIMKAQQDPVHFAPIYDKYYDAIFVYIYKRIDDEEISGELTSRVFYNCLKNLKRFKYQGVPFSAWLYKIAINEINIFFRKKSEQTRVVTLNDNHISTLIDELDRNEPKIDKYVLISTLLEQLTPDEIQLLELRFFEEKSFKQIGYFLGISEGNAKIRTYRILDKLREISKQISYTEI